MKKVLLFLVCPLLLSAGMKFSDPQPTFENPRKWVVRFNTNDLDVANHNIDAINNVLKEYPQESLQVAVIIYSKGMRLVKKNADKRLLTRIKSLMEYGVEFVGCRNTMETMKWKDDEFIDGLTFVQAGIAEAIERSVAGWVDLTPY